VGKDHGRVPTAKQKLASPPGKLWMGSKKITHIGKWKTILVWNTMLPVNYMQLAL